MLASPHAPVHPHQNGWVVIDWFVRSCFFVFVSSFVAISSLVGCYIKLLGVVININRSMRGSGIGRFGVVQSQTQNNASSLLFWVSGLALLWVWRCSESGDVQSSALFRVWRCSEHGVVRSSALFRFWRCSEFGVVQSSALFGALRCSASGVVQSSALFRVRHYSEHGVVQSFNWFCLLF